MGKGKGAFEYWACRLVLLSQILPFACISSWINLVLSYSRVPVGRVVFEVGGGGIREEIAKEGMSTFVTHLGPRPPACLPIHPSFSALRLASAKLPVQTEFITISSPPRLGSIASAALGGKKTAVEEVKEDAVALDGIIEGPADTGLPAATVA